MYNTLNLPGHIRYDYDHFINLQYTADGALVRKIYGSVAAQMAGEQGLQAETMAAAASESRLEERCGNHVFFDRVLERSYNDYGYWADGAYHYNICDYLGNVRTVVKSDGTLCERNDYYPFGMLHDPTAANADVQPHKYGGKELDRQNGLDLYDSQARWYDPVLARTTTMDSKAEEFPWVSPYAWCNANPIRLVDEDGQRPSEYEAALMAQVSYDRDLTSNNLPNDLKKSRWRLSELNTAINMNYTAWYENGLQSYLFERTIDGKTEYAYVYAGTNSIEDGLEDVAQIVGLAPQYSSAIHNARTLSKEVGDNELTFIGHSLGGGEAAASSMATGRAAITFNPAAVSPATTFFHNLGDVSNVLNYRTIPSGRGRIRLGGCIINNLQDNFGMSAPGETKYIAIDSKNPFSSHSINKFVKYFKELR